MNEKNKNTQTIQDDSNGHKEDETTMIRVSILLNPDHLERQKKEARERGLKVSALIRTKLMEFDTLQDKQRG